MKNKNSCLWLNFSYGSNTLTPVFITRVFQECLTYGGEMDYKSYLDFVLALENRNTPQGLRYLFQIMDIDNKGYLHPGDLNFFYRVKRYSSKIDFEIMFDT